LKDKIEVLYKKTYNQNISFGSFGMEDKLQKSKEDLEYKGRFFEVKASVVVSFSLKWRSGVTFIDEGIPSFTIIKQNYIITIVKVISKNTSL
jgi:hypothetical protein